MTKRKKRWIWGCLGGFVLLMLIGGSQDQDDSDRSPRSPAEEAAAAKQVRLETITKGFNPWDGSHRNLTRFLKEKMLRDPDSYEHIETHYIDKGDHLLVTTKFRSKNGFGGMNQQTVLVKADLDGNVVQVLGFQ